MTTLDRAFVKAYQRRAADSPPATADQAAKSPADPLPAAPLSQSAASPAPPPGDVLMALEQKQALSGKLKVIHIASRPHADPDSATQRSSGVRIRVDRVATIAAPRFEQLAPPIAPPSPVQESLPVETCKASTAHQDQEHTAHPDLPDADDQNSVGCADPAPTPAAAEIPSEPQYASDATPETTASFTAALQVDQLWWPEICAKLSTSGGAQFDQLADELLGADRRRHRVVAVAGSGPGAGSTTLVLCLARHLAQGGLKVAMVDADCRSPALAQRVGLAIEAGWEQVLQGVLPLEEVIVESLADKLAIVPRASTTELDALAALRMEENLNRLREQYEVLLLDWGALENPADAESLRLRQQAARPDLVLLVDDARQPDNQRLAALAQQFDTATVAVVENFAAR
jgi:Mrp family chromosome partitioning ATPase